MNTKRQPKGIPVGGQYAENSHDEAGVPLAVDGASEDEVFRRDFVEEFGERSPIVAENWLDDIYHRQGLGWREAKNLEPDEQEVLCSRLRAIATEITPADSDPSSDSIRRENRTQLRPIGVSPSRDAPGLYELSFRTSDTSSTVIRLNPHEMEAWAGTLAYHSDQIAAGRGLGAISPDAKQARAEIAALIETVDEMRRSGIDYDTEALRKQSTELRERVEGLSRDARERVLIPEGFSPEQRAQIVEDASAEESRLISLLDRLDGKIKTRHG